MKRLIISYIVILGYCISFSNAQVSTVPSVQDVQPQKSAQIDANAPSGASEQKPVENPNLHMMPAFSESAEGKILPNFIERNWQWTMVSVLLAAAVLWLVLRPRKKALPTPYETALERLRHIEKNGGDLSPKEYATQISGCLRNYIEAEHSIPANEQTTDEFLKAAAKSAVLDKCQRGQLSEILRLSDFAKFAKRAFAAEERAKLLNEASVFLQNDRKKIELVKKIEVEQKNVSEGDQTRAASENFSNARGSSAAFDDEDVGATDYKADNRTGGEKK